MALSQHFYDGWRFASIYNARYSGVDAGVIQHQDGGVSAVLFERIERLRTPADPPRWRPACIGTRADAVRAIFATASAVGNCAASIAPSEWPNHLAFVAAWLRTLDAPRVIAPVECLLSPPDEERDRLHVAAILRRHRQEEMAVAVAAGRAVRYIPHALPARLMAALFGHMRPMEASRSNVPYALLADPSPPVPVPAVARSIGDAMPVRWLRHEPRGTLTLSHRYGFVRDMGGRWRLMFDRDYLDAALMAAAEAEIAAPGEGVRRMAESLRAFNAAPTVPDGLAVRISMRGVPREQRADRRRAIRVLLARQMQRRSGTWLCRPAPVQVAEACRKGIVCTAAEIAELADCRMADVEGRLYGFTEHGVEPLDASALERCAA